MLSFTKMHSLGNDFVMLDGVRRALVLDSQLITRIADRHTGIGCDQVIVAQPASGAADFFMRIYNADGSESGQCGNGGRCFGRFLIEQGLTDQRQITVQTITTEMALQVADDWQVTANMGEPVFNPAAIPFRAAQQAAEYTLAADGESVRIAAVSMGNPHAVLQVDDVDHAPVERLGPLLECHGDFPQRANIGFAQVLGRDTIRLRVWERGVGETRACGSGACAAAAVCRQQGLVDDNVSVTLPGGSVKITWPGYGDLAMTGPAITVFTGQLPEDAL
ncbi:MAG: diaminopimelate epimerase [Arenicellales bacterium]|mgnify:FL=1|jgi:diaminopimelate epimerase|nr:diaminopimelate epimerase [Arenicellales bacterium]MDP7120475.1 diaminopimelate epimerase [Arenicellales bacterium]MDP7489203.1 diaminopimelate epimerase [Arenicellales bacterium]